MIDRNTGRTFGVAAVLTATLALVACGDNLFGPEPRDVEFAASLKIDLNAMKETLSGLFFRDDVAGTGEPAVAGDRVTVMYMGWLVDGQQFDSGEAIVLLGAQDFIAGFEEGVLGMRLGGTRTIVIPADLAYGSRELVGIPGNSVLVFQLDATALLRAPTQT